MNTKLLYLFYFLSGLTALVYEVVWAKRLGLIFGVDAWGTATVLSVFFAGLALGSFVFGRLADHASLKSMVNGQWLMVNGKKQEVNHQSLVINHLRLYGLLELGIGIYAALTPFIFRYLTQLQGFLFGALGNPEIFSFSLVTFLLSVAALIVPTTLMGGTWPAAVAAATSLIHADRKPISAGSSAGWLYGLNTLGAVVGTGLAGFLLIWLVGMNLTTYLTAAINLAIGAIVIYSSKKWSKEMVNGKWLMLDGQKKKLNHQPSAISHLLLIIFFLTGLAALALEVLWTRVLILVFGASTFAFATILAIFLLGIALGSLIASWIISRMRTNGERILTNPSTSLRTSERMARWLVGSLAVLGILVIVSIPLLGNLPRLMASFLDPASNSFLQNLTASFLFSSLILILPTTLMGVSFVLGISIFSRQIEKVASDVGGLYAVNTFGGVIGAFLAGFVLIPTLGVQKSIVIAAFVYFLGAILLAFRFVAKRSYLIWTVIVISGVILVIGFLMPSWNKHLLTSGIFAYYRDLLAGEGSLEERVERGEILFYKEGLLATVMVKKAPEGYLFMRSNGKTDASTDRDLDNFHLIGHLPLILHPEAKKALLVGIGSGISLASMAAHDLEALELVEIEPAMIEAARYFGEYNRNVLDDPKVKIVKADVRGYLRGRSSFAPSTSFGRTPFDKAQGRQDKSLRATEGKYDVIASQPSNPWVRGNANLFTREFFEIARGSLADDGLMVQWVQFYSFANEDFKSVLATFASVFPNVTVWTPVVSHDILLVGSKNPQKFDFEKVKAKVESEAVQRDLEVGTVTSSERLLAQYLFDERGLRELVGEAVILSDNKPILEFTAPLNLNRQTLVDNLGQIRQVQGNAEDHFVNLEKADKGEIEDTRRAIDLIFEAEIKAEEGRLEEAAKNFEEALKVRPALQTKKGLARVYFELARQAYDVGDLPKTVSYFEKGVNLNPNAGVYLNLSILYLQQNRLAKASEALEKAKELEPENPRLKEVEKAINEKKYAN